MQKKVFVVSDNIISPLGFTSEENFSQLKNSVSGIRLHNKPDLWHDSFQASLFENDIENNLTNLLDNTFTRFEKLLIESINSSLKKCSVDVKSSKTVFIISSTKGNIKLLENLGRAIQDTEKISLQHSAKLISSYFGNPNRPIIVSNACISGALAIVVGMRVIKSGMYDNAVIAGSDLISKFILSGFYSFQAISDEACKPFDKSRKGITLGESSGTLILSAYSDKKQDAICVSGGAITNDANHISGPSRTGEELSHAIGKTMEEGGIKSKDVDFISLHGTATDYNDEMEANAVSLSHLHNVPANSLKGYFGHTLGASGIIESIITIHSMKNNLIIPTMGYTESGVSKQINISQTLQELPLFHCIKTASGFGGCNVSVLFCKN